ncbi:MAG: TIGR04282 family arsenosugar biosynthesis glycosyltransferase [Hyphomicrobium sp.]|nr:TIGR04282 family arsenosugar biosynthesis glycosyltransferase [Hyphomicrobium sp.]
MRDQPTLVIMVKEPLAGRVKSRLARGIGPAAAASFYRQATASVLARIVRPREWRTVLAVAPDSARVSRAWPGRIVRIGQGGGDLGERLQRLFDGTGRGPIVIIGSDVPAITASGIRRAFRALGGADAVLGPSTDGGYWLIGVARRRGHAPRCFDAVRWSSAHALRDTLANLDRLHVALIDTLDDVDEPADLVRAGALRGRRILPFD